MEFRGVAFGLSVPLPIMASPVVEMWAESPTLMNRGAVGRLTLVTNPKLLDRADVVANGDVISPILKFLGTRVTVHMVQEHVELFFEYARPKGKNHVTSHLVAISKFSARFISIVYDMDQNGVLGWLLAIKTPLDNFWP